MQRRLVSLSLLCFAGLAHASDHERLSALSGQLGALAAEREALEAEWLEAAEALE